MIRKTREMIILPDGILVDRQEEYQKELVNRNDRHGKVIKEYSDFFNLGLTFKNVGVEQENYNGYMWGIAIAKVNQLAIQKDENIVFYLPDTITEFQYQYLKHHKKEFSIYKDKISLVCIHIENGKFQLDTFSTRKIMDHEKMIDILYDQIEIKFLKEKINIGEEYVPRIKN